MHSSTSSSENARLKNGLAGAAALLIKTCWPICAATAVVFAALYLIAGLVFKDNPLYGTGVEGSIVSGQMNRSMSIRNAGIIIIGDSSALMGADPVLLQKLLPGKETQSLATLGWVGPAGYTALLENYLKNNKQLDTLLFVITGASLEVDETTFTNMGYEETVLTNATPSGLKDRIIGAWNFLFYNTAARAVDMPLPGNYGKKYGFDSYLRRYLSNNNGALIDPNQLKKDTAGQYRFSLSDAFISRCAPFKKLIRSGKVKHAYLVVSPIPAYTSGDATAATRKQTISRLTELTGISPDMVIDTPVSLPDKYFATATHLNGEGRRFFTSLLYKSFEETRGKAARL